LKLKINVVFVIQSDNICTGGDYMGKIAFHKKNTKNYIQYTFRIEEDLLDNVRFISKKENIPINEILNQSLKFAINDYYNNK